MLEEAEEFAENGFIARADIDGSGVQSGAAAPDTTPPDTAEEGPSSDSAAPPPPPIARAVAQQGRRRGAEVKNHVYGGSVSYYPSKNAFEAVCADPEQGRCVLTRTAKGKAGGGGNIPRGGRPIGFLAAWLSAGQDCATKEGHWKRERLERRHAERSALRRLIAETPDGVRLLSYERPQAPGEDAEPADLRGLL